MVLFDSEGPIRKFLRNYQPILPRPKLFSEDYEYQIQLPPGVTEEQAIEIISQTPWARQSAEGIASRLGLTGEAREQAIRTWSRYLAERAVRGATSATTRRRRRERG